MTLNTFDVDETGGKAEVVVAANGKSFLRNFFPQDTGDDAG